MDHTGALTRRAFTKAVAGLAVVGYQAGAGSWIVSAGAPPKSAFGKVPRLDGTLLLDDATRDAYAQDFGQIISEKPDAVLRPGSVHDIAKMLRFARLALHSPALPNPERGARRRLRHPPRPAARHRRRARAGIQPPAVRPLP